MNHSLKHKILNYTHMRFPLNTLPTTGPVLSQFKDIYFLKCISAVPFRNTCQADLRTYISQQCTLIEWERQVTHSHNIVKTILGFKKYQDNINNGRLTWQPREAGFRGSCRFDPLNEHSHCNQTKSEKYEPSRAEVNKKYEQEKAGNTASNIRAIIEPWGLIKITSSAVVEFLPPYRIF